MITFRNLFNSGNESFLGLFKETLYLIAYPPKYNIFHPGTAIYKRVKEEYLACESDMNVLAQRAINTLFKTWLQENEREVILSLTNQKTLNNKVFLYTLALNSNEYKGENDKYSNIIIIKNITPVKVEEITLQEFFKKTGFKVKTANENVYKLKDQTITNTIKIIDKILTDSKYKNISKGIKKIDFKTADKYYQEEKNQFLLGQRTHCPLYTYDLWSMDSHARENSETLWDQLIDLFKTITQLINRKDFKVDATEGDWDDGPIDLIYLDK